MPNGKDAERIQCPGCFILMATHQRGVVEKHGKKFHDQSCINKYETAMSRTISMKPTTITEAQPALST